MPKFPIRLIKLGDQDYPELLKEIPDAPKKLYVRGALSLPKLPLVAVVGTRRHTDYGARVTRELTVTLAGAGVGIVSGLAFGIDALAHQAALDAGGYTLAVLGGGIDDATIAPINNQPLAGRILAAGGCLVSEYPSGFKPTPYSFPERNRIIAGLTLGTLVTEAPLNSGALITAKAALDYNRDVYAVPSPLYSPAGAGANRLIKNGAYCVTEPADIFDALNLDPNQPASVTRAAPATLEEAAVLAVLAQGPKSHDEIIAATKLPSAIVMSTITILEINRRVERAGGNYTAL